MVAARKMGRRAAIPLDVLGLPFGDGFLQLDGSVLTKWTKMVVV
jgi:hypothetical protein